MVEQHDGSPTRHRLFVGVETTGSHSHRDQIIELAMVPFVYSLDGRIFEIGELFESLLQPTTAMPAAIITLKGITDEMQDARHRKDVGDGCRGRPRRGTQRRFRPPLR
jgi:DNA polymerase-3 subunit epsilon